MNSRFQYTAYIRFRDAEGCSTLARDLRGEQLVQLGPQALLIHFAPSEQPQPDTATQARLDPDEEATEFCAFAVPDDYAEQPSVFYFPEWVPTDQASLELVLTHALRTFAHSGNGGGLVDATHWIRWHAGTRNLPPWPTTSKNWHYTDAEAHEPEPADESPDSFVERALTGSDRVARLSAVKQLDSKANLEHLARHAWDWRVRQEALLRLDSQAAFEATAQRDRDWAMRAWALHHMKNRELLNAVRINDADEEVRATAKQRLIALQSVPPYT